MQKIFSSKRWVQAAAFTVRYQVFVLEQGIDPALEFDYLDDQLREYVVVFIENLPIATIRYQKDDAQTVHPDRLAVLANQRNKGYGKMLLATIEQRARNEGCHTSILSAEQTAEKFYQKLGYQTISPVFFEDGIACVKMQKNLSK